MSPCSERLRSAREGVTMLRACPVLTIVLLIAVGWVLTVGCGGDDGPAGEYKWKSGNEAARDIVIVLDEDGSMTMKGSVDGEEELNIAGSWTQDGSTVTFERVEADVVSTEDAEYDDGELTFEDAVFESQ